MTAKDTRPLATNDQIFALIIGLHENMDPHARLELLRALKFSPEVGRRVVGDCLGSFCMALELGQGLRTPPMHEREELVAPLLGRIQEHFADEFAAIQPEAAA